MNKECRICVVGSANVDLTFRTPRLPKPGETLAGRSMSVGMGGKGANQAVASARLGARVVFVARVGNDSFGPQAINAYRKEGIDVSFIKQDENQPTGSAGILVDDDAENCIIAVPGANGNLSPQDVRDASIAIQNAHTLLCQLETPLDATLEAFRIARSAGVQTVLTPAPVQELPDELLALCDLCMPNRTEMELLTKCPVQSLADAETAAKILRARGAKTIAMTMGAQGAFLLDDDGVFHIPALSVNAVDPTGAGDSFTAALAVSLTQGMSLKEAALLARVVAAITVTRVGAQSAFPTLTEVDQMSRG